MGKGEGTAAFPCGNATENGNLKNPNGERDRDKCRTVPKQGPLLHCLIKASAAVVCARRTAQSKPGWNSQSKKAGVFDEKQGYSARGEQLEQVVKEQRSVLCEHSTVSSNP